MQHEVCTNTKIFLQPLKVQNVAFFGGLSHFDGCMDSMNPTMDEYEISKITTCSRLRKYIETEVSCDLPDCFRG